MPNPKEASIDGWQIRLWEPMPASTSWRAEAADKLWHKYAEGFGPTATAALEELLNRTTLDRHELLATFGY